MLLVLILGVCRGVRVGSRWYCGLILTSYGCMYYVSVCVGLCVKRSGCRNRFVEMLGIGGFVWHGRAGFVVGVVLVCVLCVLCVA